MHNWLPFDRTTLENIMHLCRDNIEGISYRDQYDNNLPKAWTITPEYEQLLRLRLDAAVEAMRRIDPTFEAPQIEKKQADGCFVVTATMGDFEHPTVALLRSFRDVWLLQRDWGRTSIRLYYRVGPAAARLISDRPMARRLSYLILVRPAAWLARRLLRRS